MGLFDALTGVFGIGGSASKNESKPVRSTNPAQSSNPNTTVTVADRGQQNDAGVLGLYSSNVATVALTQQQRAAGGDAAGQQTTYIVLGAILLGVVGLVAITAGRR